MYQAKVSLATSNEKTLSPCMRGNKKYSGIKEFFCSSLTNIYKTATGDNGGERNTSGLSRCREARVGTIQKMNPSGHHPIKTAAETTATHPATWLGMDRVVDLRFLSGHRYLRPYRSPHFAELAIWTETRPKPMMSCPVL
jgi:hypothetical protein